MEVTPVSGALGAEIAGLDLSGNLSERQAGDVRNAFLEHKVLFFRNQTLDPETQLIFARVIGTPDIYPFIQGLPGTPEVIEILKTETDKVNFGGGWHSDTAYMEAPALGTILHGLEVPDVGGDTLFANTALAYRALSEGLKRTLANLRGINSSDAGYQGGRAAGMARIDGMKASYRSDSGGYEAEHPVVRTHPETGEKSLYLSRAHTVRFVGMTAEESRLLIESLAAHITRPEFTCRFRWTPGAVALWDNRTTQHCALNDYHGKRRRMRRVTLKGERPH